MDHRDDDRVLAEVDPLSDLVALWTAGDPEEFRWRIVEMDLWDLDAIDLLGAARP
ncbi:MAG: hypothetical protein ACYDCI_06705 [Candidatus Limnocylindrales bacterium]